MSEYITFYSQILSIFNRFNLNPNQCVYVEIHAVNNSLANDRQVSFQFFKREAEKLRVEKTSASSLMNRYTFIFTHNKILRVNKVDIELFEKEMAVQIPEEVYTNIDIDGSERKESDKITFEKALQKRGFTISDIDMIHFDSFKFSEPFETLRSRKVFYDLIIWEDIDVYYTDGNTAWIDEHKVVTFTVIPFNYKLLISSMKNISVLIEKEVIKVSM